MTRATMHVVRLVGAAIHSLVALGTAALGLITGIDVLLMEGRLTEAGKLFLLAFGIHLAGAVAFLLLRSGIVRKIILPAIECLMLAATLRWLATDYAILTTLCLIMAVILAVSSPKPDTRG